MLFFSCHLDGTAVCLVEPGGGWDISRGSDLRVNRRDVECWMTLMRVLGLLWVFVILFSCPLSPFHRRCRVGVYSLSVGLPPTRVLGPLWTVVGGCLAVVLSMHPFARRCRVGVYGLCILRP